MAYRSLREFLDRLEGAGELVRVKERGRPRARDGGARRPRREAGRPGAPLREPRRPARFPVAMNLFGTRRRTSWALSCDDFEDHARELRALLRWRRPSRFWEKLKMLPKLGKLAAMAPKHVSSGPSQEVVRPRARPRRSSRCSRPGRTTAARSSRSRRSSPAIRRPGSATSGCTGSRSSARGGSRCTGSSTRPRPPTTASTGGAASGCRSPSRSAAIPPSPTAPPPRSRRTSTSTSSPASCAARRSGW